MEDKLISKTDKIFVAGHNGMAGNAIKKNLIKKGYLNVIFEDRKNLDLTNFSDVYKWFLKESPDVVILAAAKVGGILANNNYPADFLLQNLKIQSNVIEASFKTSVKRFLFLGSSCIYPKFANQPIKEEYLMEGKLEKTNEWYAIAKIAGIKLCDALRIQHGFDAISIMPTNLYGPGDNFDLRNSHVLPALIRKFYESKIKREDSVICWGSGNPKREFLHVHDLADAAVFVLENFKPFWIKDRLISYLNIGTGLDISIKELAIKIGNHLDYKGNIKWDKTKPDGTPLKKLDVSRLEKLGWEANISLDEGLKKTIQYYERKYG